MSIKLKDTIYDLINKATKDGSGNIITSTYLKKSGDVLDTLAEQYNGNYGINLNNSDIINVNAIFTSDVCEKAGEGINFFRTTDTYDSIWAKEGVLYFSPEGIKDSNGSLTHNINHTILHAGNYSSYAATKDHTHSYLPLSGGTMTGAITFPNGNGADTYLNLNNSNISGVNSIFMADTCNHGGEGLQFIRTDGNYDSIWGIDGILYWGVSGSGTAACANNYTVYHSGNLSLDNYVTKNGTGATGTWNINVSGSAATLEHKNLTYQTMDNLSGTFVYSAILDDGSDTTGIQIGDNVTKFQLDAPNSSTLRFRVNDTGGTNTSWDNWENILHTGNWGSYCAAASHSHSYASKVTVGSTAYTVSSNNITIPAYPTALACPYALTIQFNGTSQGAWTGSSAKTINITPSSIGAAAASHSHNYLPLSGGTMTGRIIMPNNFYGESGAIIMNNSDITGINAIYTSDLAENASEGYQFKRTNGNYDSIWAKDGTLYFSPNGAGEGYNTNYTIYHSGNFTSSGNAEYSSRVLRSHYGTATDGDISDRPTSANISWIDKTTRYFLATSSMTTGKPPADAKILHLAWDNAGWGSQLAIGSGDNGHIWYRNQGAGDVAATWTSWRTVLDNTNYGSYCITRSGGTINNGALNMTNNRLRMVGTSATPAWNQAGAITWCESVEDGQPVSIVYTSYDSYRAPAGLKVMGNQGGEWFEAPNIYCTTLYIGGSAITFTT